MAPPEPYATIREILDEIIGRTIVDVTQHDYEDFAETGKSYVCLMFDDGQTLKFFVGDDPFILNEGSDSESEYDANS